MSRRAPATRKSNSCATSPFTSFEKHVGDIMSSVFGGSPLASFPDGTVGLAAFSPRIDLVENLGGEQIVTCLVAGREVYVRTSREVIATPGDDIVLTQQ